MLSIPATVRVFIHREPVDFRKSHDGLSGIIRRDLGQDPVSGNLFAFLNKRRDRIKLVQFDGNGLWLHYKRLECGTFRGPASSKDGEARYTRADLALLLEGIEVKKGKLMRRFPDSIRIQERERDDVPDDRHPDRPEGAASAGAEAACGAHRAGEAGQVAACGSRCAHRQGAQVPEPLLRPLLGEVVDRDG